MKHIILRALVLSSVMLLTALSSAHAVTMNYTGGWLATTTYPAGAVVVLNKQTYYALLPGNLNNPVGWQPLGTFVPTAYKIGSRGPGFTYLEAAPVVWCNKTTTSIPAVAGWAPNAAESYITATKSDWFLPSKRELTLLYNTLVDAGVGGFADGYAVLGVISFFGALISTIGVKR
ncbi:MAG: hypothetical protein WCH01_07295 [Methylococcaceae bacterium]